MMYLQEPSVTVTQGLALVAVGGARRHPEEARTIERHPSPEPKAQHAGTLQN